MGSGCGNAGAGQATATVKSNTTKAQDDAARAKNTAAQYVQDQQDKQDPNNPLGFSVAPPADAPDLTSQAVKQRKAAQSLMLLSGRGRAFAFMGGNAGGGALSGGGTLGR